jgi:hypothetical protein
MEVCHSKTNWTSMAPGNDIRRDSVTRNNQQYDEGVGSFASTLKVCRIGCHVMSKP